MARDAANVSSHLRGNRRRRQLDNDNTALKAFAAPKAALTLSRLLTRRQTPELGHPNNRYNKESVLRGDFAIRAEAKVPQVHRIQGNRRYDEGASTSS